MQHTLSLTMGSPRKSYRTATPDSQCNSHVNYAASSALNRTSVQPSTPRLMARTNARTNLSNSTYTYSAPKIKGSGQNGYLSHSTRATHGHPAQQRKCP